MKKYVFLGLLSLLLTLPIVVGAESISSFKIGNGKYNINGVVKDDTAPYIKNGRTFLPLRYVAYAAGIGDNSIHWDQDTKTVFFSKNNDIVTIRIGAESITVGNRIILIDAPAEINQGRTMLPLRAITEVLQCEVEWDQANQLAIVKEKD